MSISWNNKKCFDTVDARCKHEESSHSLRSSSVFSNWNALMYNSNIWYISIVAENIHCPFCVPLYCCSISIWYTNTVLGHTPSQFYAEHCVGARPLFILHNNYVLEMSLSSWGWNHFFGQNLLSIWYNNIVSDRIHHIFHIKALCCETYLAYLIYHHRSGEFSLSAGYNKMLYGDIRY